MNQGAQPLPLLPIDKLIRPDQTQALQFLTPADREKYRGGIVGLWERINGNGPPHDRHDAHQRLSGVTHNLRDNMYKWRQQTGQMPQQRPQPGHQPQPQQQRLQQQPPQQQQQLQRQAQQQGMQQAQMQAHAEGAMQGPAGGGHQAAQQPEFSPLVRNEARQLVVAVPPQLRAHSLEEQQQWLNGQRLRYANLLQKAENLEKQGKDLQTRATNRQQTSPLTEQERQKVSNQLSLYRQHIVENRNAAMKLKQQHLEHARQQEQQRQQPVVNVEQQQQQQHAANQAALNGAAGPPSQSALGRPSVEGVEQDVKEADASTPGAQREDQSSAPANTMAPGTNVQASSGVAAEVTIKPEPNVSSQGPEPTAQTAPAKPLSHQDAIMRASQHAQSNQQPPHGHPAQPQGPVAQREQPAASSSLTQRPQNRPLNVAPPTPVAMAPSRPTLTGGHSTGGPMGHPAIQKHPGYVLEGEGERVLSKKKLEELVRQVTGGGAHGEGEALDPDVEETLLDVADEFVDNVITAACRLAKLRQSPQLELRDIQLILERNHNIRVPGYASDELRTVKRIQPSQAWVQKMSAVQAAKVTGGKSDL